MSTSSTTSGSRTTSTSRTTRRLQRALEAWQPSFIEWWQEMGPAGFQEDDVYLRTAISVDSDGWAHFDYVKMPDYRWGIFLADPVAGPHHRLRRRHRPSRCGSRCRASTATRCAASSSPRATPSRRASSSSAMLGHSCPSVYDLRNLFQVNVEEGRHLWAMVYLLQSYFGRDGREEAEALPRSAAAATRTSRASSAPSTSRAPTGSRSSCSRSSPTATASSSSSRSPRARFDPLVAHDALHAHRGGAPHVRRRDGRPADRRSHGEADGRARARSTPTTCARWASSICRRCSGT